LPDGGDAGRRHVDPRHVRAQSLFAEDGVHGLVSGPLPGSGSAGEIRIHPKAEAWVVADLILAFSKHVLTTESGVI
jgi:hypothetical protein